MPFSSPSTLISLPSPTTAAERFTFQSPRRAAASTFRSSPARFFIPGVGGVGNIRRTGEGDPLLYGGDYTPSELATLEATERRYGGPLPSRYGSTSPAAPAGLNTGFVPWQDFSPFAQLRALDAIGRRPY